MPTVAEIAAAAFGAVTNAIPGVVQGATLTRRTTGTYNPTTGSHSATTATSPCSVVFDIARPVRDLFPDYVIGPSEKLAYLEGLTFAPKENDTLSIGGTVKMVADIAGAGDLYAVILSG